MTTKTKLKGTAYVEPQGAVRFGLIAIIIFASAQQRCVYGNYQHEFQQ